MQPLRRQPQSAVRQSERGAIIAFLVATAVLLAGMWWLQDGQPGHATPAGIISSQQ